MACKTILIAGIFYSVGCSAPLEAEETAIYESPQVIEQAAVVEETPEGRRTGLTLKDVTNNIEWRAKTYQLLVSF